MSTDRKGALVLLSCLIVASSGWTYEIPVHDRMTSKAFQRVAATLPLRSLLGIQADGSVAGDTLENWTAKGFEEEDHVLQSFPFARSLHHFYDPVHGAPLTVGVWPLCTSWLAVYGFPPIATVRADQWGLDPQLLNSWHLPGRPSRTV